MSRSTRTEVPRLDLAPKLNRPLSLWNPFDYLRLLYWVFYFPQAFSWYLNTFSNIPRSNNGVETQERSNFTGQLSAQRLLLVQSVLLSIASITFIYFTLKSFELEVHWSIVPFGIFIGTFAAISGKFLFDFVKREGSESFLMILASVTYGLLVMFLPNIFSQFSGLEEILALSLISGILLGLVVNLVKGLSRKGVFNVFRLFIFALYAGIVFGLLEGLTSIGIAGGLLGGVVFGLAFGLAINRPDALILGIIFCLNRKDSRCFSLQAVTLLPMPLLSRKLSDWLRRDWLIGIHNINQLLTFTFQFFVVTNTVSKELRRLSPDDLIYRISQLSEYADSSDLLYFISIYPNTSLPVSTKRKDLNAKFSLSHLIRNCSGPVNFSAAGFYLLHLGIPELAREYFAEIYNVPHASEMYALAASLELFKDAETITEIAAVEVLDYPRNPSLRPVTWKAMQRFCNVISDTKTVVGSVSRTSKAFASNRALGELQHILDYVNDVPEAERQLIHDIAKQWRDALLNVATSVGQQTVEQPIQNPYVVGDPVEGSLFVGRDDILRQLEELWLMGRQMQSVVLFGHRRMGKTSILRNAAKTVGAGLRLVYVNMLRSSSAESLSDVLIAMTDEISTELGVPAPRDEDMMANPTRTCDRYLKRVLDRLNNDETLIIAIDEFEKIEELIDTGKLSPDFIAYLRGLVQMSPKLGFAFAGLHTLEEMTQDYFNPFFASVIPIKVGFLPPGAVRQLLANPNPEFLLDYQAEAFDLIYQLTSGQPYLTQLVGFQLVRRYNNQVFEQASQRESIFSAADVDAVTEDPEFFRRGRYYFTGVWDQAGRDVPEQQAILQALAPHADGLSLDDLQSATQLKRATLDSALELLDRHDVVKVENNQARILVALFRRWLLQQ